jgi:hypothetical protein
MQNMAMSSLILCSVMTILLTGCGGTAQAPIGGKIVGLSGGASISLIDNGSDGIVVVQNGVFFFDMEVAPGATYNVTIGTQPTGETCVVANGSGNVDSSGDPITNILVSCAVNS